jgi:hypothetical protein
LSDNYDEVEILEVQVSPAMAIMAPAHSNLDESQTWVVGVDLSAFGQIPLRHDHFSDCQKIER